VRTSWPDCLSPRISGVCAAIAIFSGRNETLDRIC
jgi:hypothetical protein